MGNCFERSKMRKAAISLLIPFMLGAGALAQPDHLRLGEIEFYGYAGLDLDARRAALPVHEGDDVSWDRIPAPTDRIKNLVQANSVEAVCCDNDNGLMIYIGLPGKSARRSLPAGSQWPRQVSASGDGTRATAVEELEVFFGVAVGREELAGGHAVDEAIAAGDGFAFGVAGACAFLGDWRSFALRWSCGWSLCVVVCDGRRRFGSEIRPVDSMVGSGGVGTRIQRLQVVGTRGQDFVPRAVTGPCPAATTGYERHGRLVA